MTYKESIKQSLQDYRDARIKRREAFGPDLIDTVSDVAKTTKQAVIDKKDETKKKLEDLENKLDEKVTKKVDQFKSKTTEITKGIKDYITDKVQSVHDGIRNVRDTIREKYEDYTQKRARPKRSFAERIRDGVAKWRPDLIDDLALFGSMLKSDFEAFRATRDRVRLEDRIETPSTNKVDTREVRADLTETEVEKLTPQDAKLDKLGTKQLTPQELNAFAAHYFNNYDATHKAVHEVDGKRNPTFSDYAVAAGFTTFMTELKNKPQDVVNEDVMSNTSIRDVVSDIDQIKAAQMRLQALQAERLLLEAQVEELSEKYGLDVDKIEYGQSATSVQSKEQLIEKITTDSDIKNDVTEAEKSESNVELAHDDLITNSQANEITTDSNEPENNIELTRDDLIVDSPQQTHTL